MPTSTTLRPSTPPEIWRVILRCATASETSYLADYHPFTPFPDLQETASSIEREFSRLQTCVSLVQVSRLFRAIAAPFLYEDVRICDASDLESLLLGFIRSQREHGTEHYGTYVKRLEIPRRRSHRYLLQSDTPRAIPTHPIAIDTSAPTLADLLDLCPNVEVLVRPCLGLNAEHIEFWAQLVAAPCTPRLSQLRRLDWHESDLDSRFYGSNHVSRLCEIVCLAPNLQSLFLSSDRPTALVDLILPPSIRTIRLNRSYFHAHPTVLQKSSLGTHLRHSQFTLPNFHHLILHTTLPGPQLDFLSACGSHLRVLELGFAPQTTFPGPVLHRVLSRCPNINTLALHLGAPEITALSSGLGSGSSEKCVGVVPTQSLTCLHIKVDPDKWLPYRPVLRAQMDVLQDPASFLALRDVVLHDPRGWFVRRESGREILRRMAGRGWNVVYASEDPGGPCVPVTMPA